MNALNVQLPSRRLLFTDSGSVLDAKTTALLGQWSSESSNEEQKNCFIYDIDGELQPALRVHYKFNPQNQLVVSVQQSDGAVTQPASCTFTGSIAVDDEHDVLYALTDGPGSETGQVIVLYGDLAFSGPTQLVLRLTGGGQTAIVSDESVPIAAERNSDADKAGHDLLKFRAVTTNRYADSGVTEPLDAEIGFAGQWKLWPEGLSFACSADGDLANPSLVLSLKGKCKAVAAGLEFRLNDGDVSALFVVEGEHQFDAATATWSLAIGYSQLAERSLRIQAKAKGKVSYTTGTGNTFTIEGALEFTGDGKTGQLALAIDAEYAFKSGRISFKATANWAGSKVQYDLQLSGNIKVADGDLVFEVKLDSANTTTLTLKYDGGDAAFLKDFDLKLVRDKNGKIKAGLTFSLQVTYINGVAVIKK